jgi:hypothetical protein
LSSVPVWTTTDIATTAAIKSGSYAICYGLKFLSKIFGSRCLSRDKSQRSSTILVICTPRMHAILTLSS